MTARKIYLQPSEIVYNGMLDLMDSQNGMEISRDSRNRELRFTVKMFDAAWTLRFTSAQIDRSRIEASIEIIETKGRTPGEAMHFEASQDEGTNGNASPGNETIDELRCLSSSVLRREYAMLDAMLLIGTPLEVVYNEEGGIEL